MEVDDNFNDNNSTIVMSSSESTPVAEETFLSSTPNDKKRGIEQISNPTDIDNQTSQSKKKQETHTQQVSSPSATRTKVRNVQPPPSTTMYCEQTNEDQNETTNETSAIYQSPNQPSSTTVTNRNVESHHSVLPLSMQIMRPFYVLCCQNCERTRNGRLPYRRGGNTSATPSTNNVAAASTTTHENGNSTTVGGGGSSGGGSAENRETFSSSIDTMRESVPSFINQDGRVIMEQLENVPDYGALPFGAIQHQPLYNGHTTRRTTTRTETSAAFTTTQGSHLTTASTAVESNQNNTSANPNNDTSHEMVDRSSTEQQLTERSNSNRLQHLTTIPPSPQEHTNPIMQEYISTTQIYGCKHVNPGVLTAIRFSLPTIRVSGSFHDSDMLALSEILFRHCNGALSHVKRLDFSVASREGKLHGKKGFGSHGAFTLSRVLCMSKYIEEVFIQRNRIGPYGAAAMFAAAAKNKTLKTLVMRRCLLGERGALAFAEYVGQSQECGLKEVDLSVNRIGFKGSIAIEEMLNEKERMGMGIDVDLEGNLVLQEVMNGVTHGLGIILCIIGAVLMSRRVKYYSRNHVMSCGIYSASLLVLYTSSTLYHSFFALKYTRYIFEVLDHCAIYILITGSYTPFLRIALEDSPVLSFYLLIFQWLCCICGIFVEAFYNNWIHKPKFTLAMYLGMGWACMICMPQFIEVLPKEAIKLLVLGGVGYTSGVPFFVRNNNLDHSIWHCFVLAGSIFHWLAVYQYVAPMGKCRGGELIDENMECLVYP